MKFEQGKAYFNPSTGSKLIFLQELRHEDGYYYHFASQGYTLDLNAPWDTIRHTAGSSKDFTEWEEPKAKVIKYLWALRPFDSIYADGWQATTEFFPDEKTVKDIYCSSRVKRLDWSATEFEVQE